MRKGTFLAIALIGASAYSTANYWRSVWWDKWFLVVAALLLAVGVDLRKKFHWTVPLFFMCVTVSALWAFGWYEAYGSHGILEIVAIGKVTAYTLTCLLAMGWALSTLDAKDYEKLGDGFAFLCAIDTIKIIYQAAIGTPSDARGGYFGNPSMSGCLIAMTYPYLVMQPRVKLTIPSWVAYIKRVVYLTAPMVAVSLTGSSQPVGAMVVALLAYVLVTPWRFNHARLFKLAVFVAFPLLGILVLYLLAPGDGNNGVFDSTGRFQIWRMALGWWWQQGHIWTGEGTGVSQILIPIIQTETGVQARIDPAWWLWLHSDWVQLLLENGVVGFTSGVLLYGFALWRSRLTPWLFAAVAAVGAVAVFNFPAHFAVHAFIAAATLALALKLSSYPYLSSIKIMGWMPNADWLEAERRQMAEDKQVQERFFKGEFYDEVR